jgi:hypothetical protein
MYRLVGDGVTDNTDAFRQMFASPGRSIQIHEGDYVTGPFTIPGNTLLVLDPGVTIRDSGQLGAEERVMSIRGDDVHIVGYGARVIANRADYTTGEQRHGVFIWSVHRVVIEGLESSGHGGDGFYIGGLSGNPSTDITIQGCRADNNRRQGISITSARRVYVADCELMNTNGTAPEFGVDLEPNEPVDVLDHIVLLRPQTMFNQGGGIMIALDKLNSTSEPVDIVVIDHKSEGEQPALYAPTVAGITPRILYNRVDAQ